jgi:hypothetical protein
MKKLTLVPSKEQIIKEVANNQEVQQFLSSYSERSQKNFMDHYASQKHSWLENEDYYRQKVEEDNLTWLNQAKAHLGNIQQKKLFDLQCLWRAEQITLPGIEICYDFRVWEDHIMDCPLLSPITHEDLEMYSGFLQTGEAEMHVLDPRWEWQNFDEIAGDDPPCDLPPWYEYHNRLTGAGKHLILPNLRGRKEETYINLFHDDRLERDAALNVEKDPRPNFNYWEDDCMKEFVMKFENRRTISAFNLYNTYLEHADDYLEDILWAIMTVKTSIDVVHGKNLRETIINSYRAYQGSKIAEHLPSALQSYNNEKMFRSEQHTKNRILSDEIRKAYKKQILKGRKILGEPADLNF